MRRKFFTTIFCTFALCILFAGCGEKKPLRICLDFASAGLSIDKAQYSDYGQYANSLTSFAYTFFNEVQAVAEREGIPFEYELEHLPLKGKERTEAIQRIQEEIKNGEGPDLFLIAGVAGSTDGTGALFPTPELELEKGTFLPLDSYIEESQWAEWDQFTDSVLAAG